MAISDARATGRPTVADDARAACMQHAEAAARMVLHRGGTRLQAALEWGWVADWWFASENEPAARRARAICQRCPIRTECRAHAREVEEPDGIWGGEFATERRKRHRTVRRTA